MRTFRKARKPRAFENAHQQKPESCWRRLYRESTCSSIGTKVASTQEPPSGRGWSACGPILHLQACPQRTSLLVAYAICVWGDARPGHDGLKMPLQADVRTPVECPYAGVEITRGGRLGRADGTMLAGAYNLVDSVESVPTSRAITGGCSTAFGGPTPCSRGRSKGRGRPPRRKRHRRLSHAAGHDAGQNMSTDPYVSTEAVADTRREIRTLVREIAALARSEVEPEAFFGEFLTRIVSAMAAVGGAVWLLEEGAGLALKSHVNLQQTKLADHDAEDQARHGRLIQKAFLEGSSFLALPHSETEGVGAGWRGWSRSDGPPAGNPTDCLLVLAPLRADMETRGVLEVFQRPDTGREAQRGYLRFVVQMCELAADYFRSRELRSLDGSRDTVDAVGAVHPGGPCESGRPRDGLHPGE